MTNLEAKKHMVKEMTDIRNTIVRKVVLDLVKAGINPTEEDMYMMADRANNKPEVIVSILGKRMEKKTHNKLTFEQFKTFMNVWKKRDKIKNATVDFNVNEKVATTSYSDTTVTDNSRINMENMRRCQQESFSRINQQFMNDHMNNVNGIF